MRPNADVAARIEELLREELALLGDAPAGLAPDAIAANMRCEVADDDSMTYSWKGVPILHVRPEAREGSVYWRMFTREDDAY